MKDISKAGHAPITVPVLIDDVKRDLEGFKMTRCVYLALDFEGVEPASIRDAPSDLRVLLTRLSAVVLGPLGGEAIFEQPTQIDELFEHVETEAEGVRGFGWVIEFEELWLPNAIVDWNCDEARSGVVIRVDHQLFLLALRFTQGDLSARRFTGIALDLADRGLSESPVETSAFADWGSIEIKRARADFDELRRERKVRPWRAPDGSEQFGDFEEGR